MEAFIDIIIIMTGKEEDIQLGMTIVFYEKHV